MRRHAYYRMDSNIEYMCTTSGLQVESQHGTELVNLGAACGIIGMYLR